LTQFEYRIPFSVNEFPAVRKFLPVVSSPFFVTEYVLLTSRVYLLILATVIKRHVKITNI